MDWVRSRSSRSLTTEDTKVHEGNTWNKSGLASQTA
jgi:hypothetical protein